MTSRAATGWRVMFRAVVVLAACGWVTGLASVVLPQSRPLQTVAALPAPVVPHATSGWAQVTPRTRTLGVSPHTLLLPKPTDGPRDGRWRIPRSAPLVDAFSVMNRPITLPSTETAGLITGWVGLGRHSVRFDFRTRVGLDAMSGARPLDAIIKAGRWAPADFDDGARHRTWGTVNGKRALLVREAVQSRRLNDSKAYKVGAHVIWNDGRLRYHLYARDGGPGLDSLLTIAESMRTLQMTDRVVREGSLEGAPSHPDIALHHLEW